MTELLSRPWPWYLAGPLLGLFVPVLLLVGNRVFGVSSNLRHLCAAVCPADISHFDYDWRRAGSWNLAFAAGIVVGGFLAGYAFANPDPVAIAPATQAALTELGVRDFTGLVPSHVFTWSALIDFRTGSLLVGGGLLIGFGTAYAGGCTSGHGLSGVADLQPASFVALAAFFVGGVFGTFVLLPLLLGGG